ncbi:MAG: ABC transporter permease [Oscillospiraceae bacterium]|nr:ABC transporter permease [Oscillospiraceae bacterium]
MAKQILSLYKLYLKMDIAWLFRDAKTAFLMIIADVLSNLSAVTGIFLLAWRFDGIGGMSRHEVLFMLAYSTILTGIFQTFFCGGNTAHISRVIGRGQLEHAFIQPLPLFVQWLTSGFIPISGSSNLISGIVIMIIALNQLDLVLPWWWIFSLVANLIITTALILAQSYLSASLAFYAPVQAEEISTIVIDEFAYIGNFPLSGMPKLLQISLITIIPTGLLAWFPTLALFGKTPFGITAWYPLFFAIILWIIALYFFKKGLKYYVKKGINRYHPMGHRR